MSPLVALAAAVLTATPVSTSHLGVVVLGSSSDVTTILAACPRLVVVPLPADGLTELSSTIGTAVGTYRRNCTGSFVIVQVGGSGAVDLSNPVASWGNWVAQVLGAQSFFTVDGVEGPSEPVGTPSQLATFWSSLAFQIRNSGFLPIVGALPSGLPSGAGTSSDAFCQVASQVASAVGGSASYGWSYHARSPTMTTNVATESSTTLAYRQIISDCGLRAPLYITEAGPIGRAWESTDLTWAEFLDMEIQADGVTGAALFEAGGSDSYTLSPLVVGLTGYLANPGGTDGGSDGGSDGGTGSQVGGGGIGPGHLGTSDNLSGCAVGGAGVVALLVLPLFLLRRRRVR